jgi:hypothetical protein
MRGSISSSTRSHAPNSPGSLQVINSYISPFHPLSPTSTPRPHRRSTTATMSSTTEKDGGYPQLSFEARTSRRRGLIGVDRERRGDHKEMDEAESSALIWLVSQDLNICENRSGLVSCSHSPVFYHLHPMHSKRIVSQRRVLIISYAFVIKTHSPVYPNS